jgi:hypothetical protein
MTDTEYELMQREANRLLNDRETPIHPWALLEVLPRAGSEPNRRAT